MRESAQNTSSELMTLGEIARYLKVSEKTIKRMVQNGKIPAAKVSNQWRFMKSFVDDWLITKMQHAKKEDLVGIIATGETFIPISRLTSPDRIIMNIKPGSKKSILRQLIKPIVREGIIKNEEAYLKKLMGREEMVSTAVGRGIALPHVRDPEKHGVDRPLIVLGICPKGTDFDSLDGEKTYIFALCVSGSEAVHLRLLAKISFFLRQDGMVHRLSRMTQKEGIIAEMIKADSDLTISF